MKLAVAITALVLTGCAQHDSEYKNDPEIVARYFEQCMNLVPEGPKQVHNNDWDEVISECRWYSRSQAVQHQRINRGKS